MLSEPRILFPWQNIQLTDSGSKCSPHIHCYVLRAPLRDSRHSSLFTELLMIFGCWAFPVFNITLNVVLQTRYQTEFLGLWEMFLLNIEVRFLKSSLINIRPTSDLNSSFIRYCLYWFPQRKLFWQKVHFRGFIALWLSRIFPKKRQSLLHFTRSCLCHDPTD